MHESPLACSSLAPCTSSSALVRFCTWPAGELARQRLTATACGRGAGRGGKLKHRSWEIGRSADVRDSRGEGGGGQRMGALASAHTPHSNSPIARQGRARSGAGAPQRSVNLAVPALPRALRHGAARQAAEHGRQIRRNVRDDARTTLVRAEAALRHLQVSTPTLKRHAPSRAGVTHDFRSMLG